MRETKEHVVIGSIAAPHLQPMAPRTMRDVKPHWNYGAMFAEPEASPGDRLVWLVAKYAAVFVIGWLVGVTK